MFSVRSRVRGRSSGTGAPAWHAVVVLALAASACGKMEKGLGEEAKRGTGSGRSTLVVVEPLTRGAVEDALVRTSEIEALLEVPLESRVAGTVTEVLVDVGDRVERDDVLVRLDPAELQLEEQRTLASLEDAREQRRQSEIALEEAGDQKATAIRRREQAEREHERTLQLSESRIASASELEVTQLALDDALAEERASTFRERRAQVDRDQADHAVRLAEIAWESAKLRLGYTEIKAPFAGAISTRDIDPGAVVGTSTPLLQLVDDRNLIVHLKITQKDLLRVQHEQRVEVEATEALPGRTFPGVVERISPVVEIASGSMLVRVRLLAEGTPLRPGLFVSCRILTDVHADSILVPRRAVFWQDQQPAFFLVEEGIARKVGFVPGPGTGDHAQVLMSERQDLEAGMAVVVIGKDRLQDGDPVRVRDESTPAAPPTGEGGTDGSGDEASASGEKP